MSSKEIRYERTKIGWLCLFVFKMKIIVFSFVFLLFSLTNIVFFKIWRKIVRVCDCIQIFILKIIWFHNYTFIVINDFFISPFFNLFLMVWRCEFKIVLTLKNVQFSTFGTEKNKNKFFLFMKWCFVVFVWKLSLNWQSKKVSQNFSNFFNLGNEWNIKYYIWNISG